MSFPDDFVLPGRSEVDGDREADRQRRAAAARAAIAEALAVALDAPAAAGNDLIAQASGF